MAKKTPLYDAHVRLGGHMTEYAGWDLPVEYSGLKEEHEAVRERAGIFDVSHMGEIWVTGKEAEKFVSFMMTNDIIRQKDNQVQYTFMCEPNGFVVDDLLVYRYNNEKYYLVVNAANSDKDFAWILEESKKFDVEVKNVSDETGQVAVQGPKAEEVVQKLTDEDLSKITFFTFKDGVEIAGKKCLISRTGYTGEDGFEIYGSHAYIINTWDALMASKRCVPCGLGCRDTLRFEVGLPLYGNELSAEISPVMAGLSMFCKLDKEEFIGKEAIVKQKEEGVKQRVIGLELQDKAIPRHGYAVLRDGQQVGVITTGYHAISVDKSVAFALVNKPDAKLGTELEIQIRKKTFKCVVVKKRFYDKHYKKD